MFRRVYMDNAATTAVDERVFEAMKPFLTDKFGNASSIHFFGQEARGAVDRARHQTASLINAKPREIVFTSGGTESNNLAIRGLRDRHAPLGGHIVTTAIEHPAVSTVCEELEANGCDLTVVAVGESGIVNVEDIMSAVRPDTFLVSVMMANNEIGTIQKVAEIGNSIRAKRANGEKIWFHTDAVQAAGKIPVDVEEIGCDLLSISGHKIYAPKGVGALFVRRGVRLKAQNVGGHQEREVRGGTENVPGIVAFGTACELADEALSSDAKRIERLRKGFESFVFETIPGASLNGEMDARLPNISNISFDEVEGEGLLINLDMQGVAVSTGSACSSGSIDPSPVILALGRDDTEARGAVRFSFGKNNTEEDLAYLKEVLPKAVDNLRKLSPRYQSAPGE
jgi:cysteine desulfurase